MKVDKKGHTSILKDTEGNLNIFLKKIEKQHTSFKDQNLILDVSHDNSVSLDTILQFDDIAQKHKNLKKSFVIVADNIDFNEIPDSLTVVPSVLEAHDLIEMDEIERDLGF